MGGGTGGASAPSGNGGKLAGGHGGTQGGITGEAGGGDAGAPGELPLCARLGSSVSVLLEYVAEDFENAFCADCRVNWVYSLCIYDPNENETVAMQKRIAYLNQLSSFSYALWGCLGSEPPTSFGLLDQPKPLSLDDANALIDEYVAVATKDLSMSPDEIEKMRGQLVPLSQTLLISPDPGGFSQPNCSATGGTGGEGGQSGEGGGGQAGQANGGQVGLPSGGQAGLASGGQAGTGQAGTGHAGAG
jgi:hypothetical protein